MVEKKASDVCKSITEKLTSGQEILSGVTRDPIPWHQGQNTKNDIIILNLYISKYMKQKLKQEVDKSTTITGDFNSLLWVIVS